MDIQIARHRHIFSYLLYLVPIIVNILGTILQDFIFVGFISFLSPIFPYCDLVDDIYTDVVSPRHIKHTLYLCPATQTPLLYYLYYVFHTPYAVSSIAYNTIDDNIMSQFYTSDLGLKYNP